MQNDELAEFISKKYNISLSLAKENLYRMRCGSHYYSARNSKGIKHRYHKAAILEDQRDYVLIESSIHYTEEGEKKIKDAIHEKYKKNLQVNK